MRAALRPKLVAVCSLGIAGSIAGTLRRLGGRIRSRAPTFGGRNRKADRSPRVLWIATRSGGGQSNSRSRQARGREGRLPKKSKRSLIHSVWRKFTSMPRVVSKSKEGPVKKQLMQQGWRAFLVKVHNEAGINPELVVESPNALPVYQKGKGARQKPMTDDQLVTSSDLPNRWLDVSMLNRQPMKRRLSGLEVEYRVVMLFSRDAGKREASLAFNIGAGHSRHRISQ